MAKVFCINSIYILFLAGGVYYMISRALGPALGGSIGLMFTVANTISVATYTIGFSESLLDFLQVNISFLYCYTLKIMIKI